jgi:hypothetical protein
MLDYNAIYIESAARFLFDDLESLKYHLNHETEIMRATFKTWNTNKSDWYLVSLANNKIVTNYDYDQCNPIDENGWFKGQWHKRAYIGTNESQLFQMLQELEPITHISLEFENKRQCTISNYYGNTDFDSQIVFENDTTI